MYKFNSLVLAHISTILHVMSIVPMFEDTKASCKLVVWAIVAIQGIMTQGSLAHSSISPLGKGHEQGRRVCREMIIIYINIKAGSIY